MFDTPLSSAALGRLERLGNEIHVRTSQLWGKRICAVSAGKTGFRAAASSSVPHSLALGL